MVLKELPNGIMRPAHGTSPADEKMAPRRAIHHSKANNRCQTRE